jgi:hypothetical protein
VVLGGLQQTEEAGAGRCPGQAPPPEVVIGLSGCYYEFDGQPIAWFDDLTGWANKRASIHVFDGDKDAVCPGRQPLRTGLPRHG